jgi:hypothetical protein
MKDQLSKLIQLKHTKKTVIEAPTINNNSLNAKLSTIS